MRWTVMEQYPYNLHLTSASRSASQTRLLQLSPSAEDEVQPNKFQVPTTPQ
eukprot:m.117325 g.117325  ORF g.117325 m.117325 type:complete len:51 (-) comp13626_c0_seq3:2435-2587(-)